LTTKSLARRKFATSLLVPRGKRPPATLLAQDEARRIAVNIAKLPFT
jgi:hypothetical protein